MFVTGRTKDYEEDISSAVGNCRLTIEVTSKLKVSLGQLFNLSTSKFQSGYAKIKAIFNTYFFNHSSKVFERSIAVLSCFVSLSYINTVKCRFLLCVPPISLLLIFLFCMSSITRVAVCVSL